MNELEKQVNAGNVIRCCKTYCIRLSTLKEGYEIANKAAVHIYNMAEESGGSIEAEIAILPNPKIDKETLDLFSEIEKRDVQDLNDFIDPYQEFYGSVCHNNPCFFITIKGITTDYTNLDIALLEENQNKTKNSRKLNYEVNNFIADYLDDPFNKKYDVANLAAKSSKSFLYIHPYINDTFSELNKDYKSSAMIANIRHIKAFIPIDYLNILSGVISPHQVSPAYITSPKEFILSNKFILVEPDNYDSVYSKIHYYTFDSSMNCIKFPDKVKTSMTKVSKNCSYEVFSRELDLL